jgi:hypothetical protein
MKLMVDQRSTKVLPKVQAWYAFWYAWFGSHDIPLTEAGSAIYTLLEHIHTLQVSS